LEDRTGRRPVVGGRRRTDGGVSRRRRARRPTVTRTLFDSPRMLG